ncbi:thiamine phosphate synthase [Pontibacter akesuensis]|uniref:Thiamine-phosphate synthase n=1 Tax=Pontibacter akesuensis TaxID=388950 RepID=A0A1I7JB96_9BACT|nr:thiamine phosphate synthase [Pontibacter akesuensis]GHA71221.1 thiamine-phosphate synthase [Pontibacter akesuensis]SFU82477.1 thiamine-phosphate diphosphorylase [Pontibacter akesuensis]
MISTLHYITQETDKQTHAQAAEAACRAGADWVQLRVKNKPYEVWKALALQTKSICRHYGSTFILNDNPALAAEVGADGVHLGKLEMAPAEARKLLGPTKIIGGTANTFEDVKRLLEQGVDYVGLGPYRFTTTKDNLSPILGLQGYTAILEQCSAAGITIPIVAIGGITAADVPLLLPTGIHGIAVSSAITLAANRAAAISEIKQNLQPLPQHNL